MFFNTDDLNNWTLEELCTVNARLSEVRDRAKAVGESGLYDRLGREQGLLQIVCAHRFGKTALLMQEA